MLAKESLTKGKQYLGFCRETTGRQALTWLSWDGEMFRTLDGRPYNYYWVGEEVAPRPNFEPMEEEE